MRLLICVLVVFGWLGGALAQDDAAADNQCTIIAKTAAGHYIAYCGFDYFPDDESPAAFQATYGWSVFGCGEPLELQLGAPLSLDDYDPLKPVSCGEGVDPAAMAALTNSSMYLRYGFCTKPCFEPAHPSGEFFSTELPGGGTAILRLPAGTSPFEVYTEWRGERYPMARLDVIHAARLMLRGEPDPTAPADSLETAVARVDCATVIALADDDRARQAELLIEAALAVQRCIEKYHERHGVYPAQLADLVTIPGAVVARLPYNPYNFDDQLGLEMGSAVWPTVAYIPEEVTAAGGEPSIGGYWLAVHGAGEPAPPRLTPPVDPAVVADVILWLESHPVTCSE